MKILYTIGNIRYGRHIAINLYKMNSMKIEKFDDAIEVTRKEKRTRDFMFINVTRKIV